MATLGAFMYGMSRVARKYMNFLFEAVKQGISVYKFQRALREHLGIKQSRSQLMREYSIVRNAIEQWTSRKFYPSQVVTGVYRKVVKKLDTKYKSVIELEILNERTGETFSAFVTVGHDRQVRLRDLIRVASNTVTNFGQASYLKVLGGYFREGYRSR